MRSVRKIFSVILVVFALLPCMACSGLDTLSDNLKGGIKQLGNDVVIGKSNAIITPYKSFEGSRTSDNTAFLATYDATVAGFDGQDILVGNTNLKSKDCHEITIHYKFAPISGTCKMIYIDPELEETVLVENGTGSITVQLQTGANYIGIYGTDYSGSIQITVEGK